MLPRASKFETLAPVVACGSESQQRSLAPALLETTPLYKQSLPKPGTPAGVAEYIMQAGLSQRERDNCKSLLTWGYSRVKGT